MGDKTNPSSVSTVVSVRGGVLDIWFDAHLPPLYPVLRTVANTMP